jgi:multiple sugar transport system permease protein
VTRRALPTLVAAAAALFTVAPLLWMVSVSFMARGEASGWPPPLLPGHPTLNNYRELLFGRPVNGLVVDFHVPRAIWNSFALASLAAGLNLLFAVPAGYAFAKLRFRGRTRLFRLLLAAAVVPGQVAMLPLFLLLKEVGLANTYAGALAPGLAATFAVLLVRQACLSIPDEMLDAARMDGAGEGQVFLRVVLPLLRPVLVTLALFAFLGSWNDFLWPLIILSDQQLYTLPVALAAMSRAHVQEVELLMAGSVVTTAPVLIVFLLLQRHYFEGVLGGGIKG